MKVVLQRVSGASVAVDGEVKGEIGRGYLVFLGIGETDTETNAEKLADKIGKLRIFPDENGKTNLSISDVGGELLVISQFTLYADCRKNRPGFSGAANPGLAEKLYDYFVDYTKRTEKFAKVEQGVFGASMQVQLTNDGPFTILLED